ncbi:YcxB family protein [Streptomyces griseus]|uniref:YcxB family protein n=1 Tax=Streptomyces griseus TaxID=1911 RepID=UPI0004C6F749|nr:YcxB family protein [Streptomyces griseus]
MNGTTDDTTAHDRIELAYPAVLADVREAVRVSLRAARWWRALRWLAHGAAVLALLIALLELLLPGEPDAGTVALMAGLGAAAVAVFHLMGAATGHALFRAVRAQGEVRAVVDAEGGRWTARDTEQTIRWSMLPRYAETDRLFVLLTPRGTGSGFAYLPKHGLVAPADADRLRSLLDRHSSRL